MSNHATIKDESSVRRFKPYSAYKDSGVEWLGCVPERWKIMRLKFVARFGYGDSLANEDRVPGEYDVYGSNGIVGQHERPNTKGPCVIVGRKGSFGKVAYSERPCFAIDTTYYIDVNQTDNDLRWLYYALQWLRLDAVSKDSAVPGLSREDAYVNAVPFCGRDEQRAIAAFLDRETERIDQLIAKKERQIELLQEKRSAIICLAVTKGLNPKAKMKDSGIEWLGEIPGHWEVKKFKFLIDGGLVNGLFKKKEHFGSGVRLVNVFDVYRDNFLVDNDSLDRVEAEPEEVIKYGVQSGDIFFVRSSLKLEGVGRSVCASEVTEPTVFECHVVRARPNQQLIVPRYLINYLNSLPAINRFIALANMVTMATIDQDNISCLEIPLPPMEEQNAIVMYLDRQISSIDNLAMKITDSITKLRECRTALISAAVTGKIDVREEVA